MGKVAEMTFIPLSSSEKRFRGFSEALRVHGLIEIVRIDGKAKAPSPVSPRAGSAA